MSCPAPEDLLAWRQGELAEEERRLIAAHAPSCAACAAELDRVERTLRAVRAVEVIEPAPDFTARVMAAVDRRPAVACPASPVQTDPADTAWEKFLAWTRLEHTPAWAISAAAHLVLFAVLAYMFIPPVPVQPSLDPGFIVRLVPYEAPVLKGGPAQIDPAPKAVTEADSTPDGHAPGTGPGPGESPANSTAAVRPGGLPPNEVATPRQKSEPGGDAPGTATAQGPADDPLRWLPPVEAQHGPRPFDAAVKPGGTRPARPFAALSRKQQDELDRRFSAYILTRLDPDRRRTASEKSGGGGEIDRAVRDGLIWLQQHQQEDGFWPVPAFKAGEEYRVGVTSLATLAFLGYGVTHESGPMAPAVRRALDALASEQAGDGRFGPATGHVLYNHALATLVFLEAAQLSGEPVLRDRAVLGAKYILDAQNWDGGWGYTAKCNTSDSSVTGWQVMALRLAGGFNVQGVSDALAKAGHWITEVTNREGRVGYNAPDAFPNGANALTASGFWSRMLIGAETADAVLDHQQTAILLGALPEWRGPGREIENDYTYWLHGSLALFQRGGQDWTAWNDRLQKTLLAGRVTEGDEAGSWRPADRWSGYGGPVYATAMGVLALETPYRYPVFVK
ncbi:MAG: hypothetical protein HYY93_10625 [Planctomycetes bacterium]|nr:hypothetical protein [Planctomycetota bacterium]